MARDNRVRVSEEELERLDDAAEELWGDDAAEDVPRGKTVGKLAEAYLGQGGGDD